MMKMKERENRLHLLEADREFQRSQTDIFFFLVLLLLLLFLLGDAGLLVNCYKKVAAHSVSPEGRRKEEEGGRRRRRREAGRREKGKGTIGRCLKAQPVSESSPGLIRSNADGVPERKEA